MVDPRDDSELLLGRRVIEQGLTKSEQVQECMRLQAKLASDGVTPLPKLGELLVKMGYLTPAQHEAMLPHSCTPAVVREADLPPEAAQAPSQNRIGKYIKTLKQIGRAHV